MSEATPAISKSKRARDHALLEIRRIYEESSGATETLLERIRHVNMEGSQKELVVVAELDILHEEMALRSAELSDLASEWPNNYDNIIVSSWYSFPAIINCKIFADVISYVFTYEWNYIKDFIDFAIMCALTERTIFLQSAESSEIVRSKETLRAILLKIFMYKGELNYGLLQAFGVILIETNIFSGNEWIKTFIKKFECRTVYGIKPDKFEEDTVPKVILEARDSRINKKKLFSLVQIMIGYINVILPEGEKVESKAQRVLPMSMSSKNVRVDRGCSSYIKVSDEAIIRRNSSKDNDDQYQVDNVARAILGKFIIARKLNDNDTLVILDKIKIH